MWKNAVEPDRPQITVQHDACAFHAEKLKATNTERVMRIASPRQQWLHERTSLLRYTYIACLSVHFQILACLV